MGQARHLLSLLALGAALAALTRGLAVSCAALDRSISFVARRG